MGRPKRVFPEKLHLFDKLHTDIVKMFSGVTMTALHLIKETEQYYLSIDSWAFCASQFKIKKKNLPELKVTIPEVTDEKSLEILDNHAWHDHLKKRGDESDMVEAVAFLDRLFPDKKKVFLYEFNTLISAYCNGNFGEIDDEGNKVMGERTGRNSLYYNQKYCGSSKYHHMNAKNYPKEIQKLYDAYQKVSGDKEKSQPAYNAYANATEAYDYEHNNVTENLFDIGSKSVVCPYAFTKGTGMWAVEKYGKPTSYSAAGEIFFVVTADTVYFEVGRHY